nr:MAG TPA: holin [Caudoviricetes sp.]
MTINMNQIVEALISLIAAVFTCVVIPLIRSKVTTAQFEKIKMYVGIAVKAAEQIYVGNGRGTEKKQYVVEYLEKLGLKIDAETLDKLIEAAVFDLPKYFVLEETEKAE